MATSVRVTCIHKSDRYNAHERILFLGGVGADGVRWTRTQQQVVQDIDSNHPSVLRSSGRTEDRLVRCRHESLGTPVRQDRG
jgi:hypothetical protein